MSEKTGPPQKPSDDPGEDLSIPIWDEVSPIDISKLFFSGLPSYKKEERDYNSEREAIQNTDLKLRVWAKIVLTTIIVVLIFWWVAFIMKVILNSGWHNFGFYLDVKVLITLLTTTTANILVLMHFVVKHFFPTQEELNTLEKKNKKKQAGKTRKDDN